ncbi:tRNA (adenosine(37)-N6)-threonylcarbamoyltransferase complex ATPase subunit type 1 TsaE [Yeosuana sp. MJ-SS3]|uniref:tRNA threonylcarbamoyladenosine biosynthesis protein TsaE n=1 Tax=Gilvirhabdus luticola TaxID=3079858 RepID=A0ABU3U9P0_9FLAO|nr:tRNA (adenosine(37)-N6)-threonylcarbamoyltransferase complex ATPase subunit type 1 TsaE [Yeosuana sp. MJ-SS3]MDU8887122.1 tRNA (adenosine(37)-N6)-threonylcarbamoyltransferase complex ATPase subunit type 1 TsaE [Yeosuana sp. MJ-SS3]
MELIYTLDNVDKVAKQLIQNARTKTLLLYGNMGVGKTTLIKQIVKSLGSADEVTSPTFSIVNEYHTKSEIIYHFDFYRINDIEEAYNFGVEEYLYSNNWCIIEWPDKIQSILPKLVDIIDLVLNSDNSRTLKLNSIKEKNKLK